MKRKTIAVSLLCSSILIGVAMHFARAEDDKSDAKVDSDKPAAAVTTAPLRQGEISQMSVAYGSVAAEPGMIAVMSVPYESRVKSIAVAAGQSVDKSASLVEIEPSPAAKLALAEAQSNLDLAVKDLAQTRQRFEMKLGTSTDLLQSQQAVDLGKLRLNNLAQQGAGSGGQKLISESAGLIAKVDVQQGQIVPAGNPLVETIARDLVEVRLGVEPSLVSRLSVGQSVHLFLNGDGDPIDGKIRLITLRVNPDTRLVDVFVAPASLAALQLDGFVRAEVVTDTRTALIAPRNAVIIGDDGATLFTVKDGTAIRHIVTLAMQNDHEAAVAGNDLHVGDTVVTEGNLELDDKMPVREDGK